MKDNIASAKTTTGKLEKVLYAMGDVGCNFIWTFAASFIALYYTDSVGVTATFVGTMMLVARIFDGLSDIGMGIIIDKTNTRFGKARPWILIMCVPFAISLVLLFNVPAALSIPAKGAYIYATYIFMAVICYTAINLAYHAMLPRITTSSDDRNIITVVRTMFVIVAAVAINAITNPLLQAFGGQNSQAAWTKVSTIYAGIALICLIGTFFGVTEKVGEKKESSKEDKNSINTKEALKVLLQCKYFYIAAGVFALNYTMSGATSGIGIYFFRDVIGNANLFGISSIISILPMAIVMPLMPVVFKKIGKVKTMMLGCCIMMLGGVGQFILVSGEEVNIVLYFMVLLVKTMGNVPMLAAIFTLASDVVDYNVWKTGIRAEGITTSINSFGMKLGTGLGAAIMGWCLDFGKYNPALEQQLPQTIAAMKFIAIGIPFITSAIILVLLLFWDMDKYKKEIQASLEG